MTAAPDRFSRYRQPFWASSSGGSCRLRCGVGELLRETVMLRRATVTSEECRRRAEEAQTLAAQTQDDWERELFKRITTQWHVLAVRKKDIEKPLSTPSRPALRRFVTSLINNISMSLFATGTAAAHHVNGSGTGLSVK